jgi:RNA polymerase sigma-70 factor (ECF subfamily)
VPDREANLPEDSELFIRKTFETDPQKGCELLYRLYYRAMCTHAVRFVYSKEIAEDIVSEIFYSFWSKKIYASVTTSYRAYLFRSVRNRSYNYLSNDLRKSDPLSAASENIVSEAESPEKIMQMDELLEILNKLISSLPPQCQKIFLMNRFEGRKSKEIAEELNLSPRTVETHIFKALHVLKNGLKNQWFWANTLLFFY